MNSSNTIFNVYIKYLYVPDIMKLRLKFVLPVILLLLVSPGWKPYDSGIDTAILWNECKLDGVIQYNIFKTAISGFSQIENIKKKNLITIIDFSRPSSLNRFYVIDLEHKKLVYNCLVAHGKNSGDLYPNSFSNTPETLKSSLGFYLTGETYSGKHGYALRLDGLENGINNNARSREIVIHGADYVSEEFVRKYGRLGKSWGCPALPVEMTKEIIDMISGGSCLFIYADDKYYREHSAFLSPTGL
jgi:hypothetical protein